MRSSSFIVPVLCAAVAACSADSGTRLLDPAFSKGKPSGETDPTAAWFLPLSGEGPGLRSDGTYATGSYSVYQDGVCGVTAKIFATAQASNSGDATLNMDAPKAKCGRRVTLVYPDGFSESVRTFANARRLQNTTSRIEVGETEARTFAISPGNLANNPSRCGRLIYGQNGSVAAGSDSVMVHRVAQDTWHVFTADGAARAWCESTGEIFEIPVSLRVVSNRPLP